MALTVNACEHDFLQDTEADLIMSLKSGFEAADLRMVPLRLGQLSHRQVNFSEVCQPRLLERIIRLVQDRQRPLRKWRILCHQL
jgi:hypothetical protein